MALRGGGTECVGEGWGRDMSPRVSMVTIIEGLLVTKNEGRSVRNREDRPLWGSAPNPALAVRQPGQADSAWPGADSVDCLQGVKGEASPQSVGLRP